MPAQTFRIIPDPQCPERIRLDFWPRLWNWLRRRPAPRFVWCHPDGVQIVCHPTTVPWLKAYLERQGHKYTQEPPVLRPATPEGR